MNYSIHFACLFKFLYLSIFYELLLENLCLEQISMLGHLFQKTISLSRENEFVKNKFCNFFRDAKNVLRKLGKINFGKLNFGTINYGKINSGKINSGKINSGKIDSSKINSGKINFAKPKLGKFNFAEIRGHLI